MEVGQDLSEKARDVLDLGRRPVKSMRALVEDTLCIPVIHAELAQREIAGATISVTDGDETWRGIVLNLLGDNKNPLVRRATIAHEIAHLLYDPDGGRSVQRRNDLCRNCSRVSVLYG